MKDSNDYIEWRKNKPNDKTWWGDIYHGISEKDIKSGNITTDDLDAAIWWDDDEIIFSFNKEKVFHLFKDYPDALTPEEKATFDKENPHWVKYFKNSAKSSV